VLLFHAGFYHFPGAFVGVDIFFVISGFLINRLVVEELETTGTFSFRHFYLRRARRLGPALVATCTFTFITAAFLFAPDHLSLLAASLIAALTSTSNIYLWQQAGYFDALSAVKPLLHTWSLSVEEQFYLVWPGLVFLVYRNAKRPRRTLVALISLSFVLSLAGNLWAQNGITETGKLSDGPTLIFYWMPFRVFELALGAALGWIIDRKIPPLVQDTLFALGFAFVGYAVRRFNDHTIFPSLNGLIPCIGAALIMLGSRGKLGVLLRNQLAVGVGLISYSLYLIHWPLIVFWSYTKSKPLTDTDRFAIIAISIALAVLMYRYVETPFRKIGHHRSSRKFIFGLAATAAALVLIAIPARSGWEWRTQKGALLQSANSQYGGTDCLSKCSHGTAPPVIFVIGDSFSRHLYAGLISSFPEQHFEFVDEYTCSFFSLKWSRWESLPNQQRDCQRDHQELLQRLKAKDARVILSYNWVRLQYFDVEKDRSAQPELKTFQSYDDDLAMFIFAQISELKSELGFHSVLVVGNPPSVGDDIGDLSKCLGRPFMSNCQYTRESAVDFRRYLVRYASRQSIPFIDPFEALCSESACKNYEKEGLFYSDEYHLSRLGSRVLIDHFKPQIAEWMFGKDDLSPSN
jgi:peptidoglycan/LPS O-acetylase OafA/YrhL